MLVLKFATTWDATLTGEHECSWIGFYGSISCVRYDFGQDIGDQTTVTSISFFAVGGEIPADIGLLKYLASLSLTVGSLGGTLPDTIGQLTLIETFDVSSNALTGTIPTSVENWANALKVSFSRNDFSGSVPTGLCPDTDPIPPDVLADCEDVECMCCALCNYL